MKSDLMKSISELNKELPAHVIESLAAQGFNELNPLQELVFKNGIPGQNILVSAPTASGKTLVAEILCINSIINRYKKAVYIAPLKALVMEKYNDFKANYPYFTSAVSIGDLDANDSWLSNFDMIFVSTEKFDSLIRHNADWIEKIGCIVFDEIHMLDDLSRGATLELLITKLKANGMQIAGLSATIGNAKELGAWLNADVIESDYRPTKLQKGALLDSKIYFSTDSNGKAIGARHSDSVFDLIDDHMQGSQQVLIFYSTKRNTENEAVKLANFVGRKLKPHEKAKLKEISEKVLNVLEIPTEQCSKLSRLVGNGVAFHHSGLLPHQRALVENAFRENLIKVICSTTTLGMGVNLPAHTVLIKNIYRFNAYASEMLDTNEVLQLLGRAGRPKYDTEGLGLVAINAKKDLKKVFEKYITASPSAIDSKLAIAPLLRAHILSFISQDYLNTQPEIEKFIAGTFYGFQYSDKDRIKQVISSIITELHEWGFIEERGSSTSNERFIATRLGKRISELYIDPLSAKWILDAVKDIDSINAGESSAEINQDLMLLYLLSNTQELRPYNRPIEESNFFFPMYMNIGSAFYESNRTGEMTSVNAFTTSMMLGDWIMEVKENEIIEKYGITPGFLYSKLSNADWIAYAIAEMFKILRRPQNKFLNLRIRLKYGIKYELLDLVRLKGIGRVRARMLYREGIRTVNDLKAAGQERVQAILGKEVGTAIMSQIQ